MIKISIRLSFLFIAFALISCAGGDAPKKESVEKEVSEKAESTPINYTIDKDRSVIVWKGSMLGMYAHEGTLNFVKGMLSTNNGEFVKGKFMVDMNSIIPTDDGYDPEAGKGPEVLVGHLSSDDFFNVAEFPTSSLTIVNGEAKLKIRGVENPVELKDFNFQEEGDLFEGEGSVTFDRKKFDVAFDHPAKEMVLSDDIEITVKIVAFRN